MVGGRRSNYCSAGRVQVALYVAVLNRKTLPSGCVILCNSEYSRKNKAAFRSSVAKGEAISLAVYTTFCRFNSALKLLKKGSVCGPSEEVGGESREEEEEEGRLQTLESYHVDTFRKKRRREKAEEEESEDMEEG